MDNHSIDDRYGIGIITEVLDELYYYYINIHFIQKIIGMMIFCGKLKKNLHIKLALWFDQSLCKLWSDPSKTKEALDNIDSQLQALKVVSKETLLPMEVPILSPEQQTSMVLQGDLNHQCTENNI